MSHKGQTGSGGLTSLTPKLSKKLARKKKQKENEYWKSLAGPITVTKTK